MSKLPIGATSYQLYVVSILLTFPEDTLRKKPGTAENVTTFIGVLGSMKAGDELSLDTLTDDIRVYPCLKPNPGNGNPQHLDFAVAVEIRSLQEQNETAPPFLQDMLGLTRQLVDYFGARAEVTCEKANLSATVRIDCTSHSIPQVHDYRVECLVRLSHLPEEHHLERTPCKHHPQRLPANGKAA